MSTNPSLRWGVLGTADINSTVVPAMTRCTYGQVVAIASRSLPRAQAEATRLGIDTAYGSYEELLAAADVDAVYICLPNFLHKEWVLAAAAAGKHILCEKPMAISAADATEMVNAAGSAGVLLAEAFMYGHHPRYDRIHDIVSSGEIGEVRSITGTFTFDASEETGLTAFAGHPGGGAVYDVGCYVVHAARQLLGQEPTAVTAYSQISIPHGDIDMMTAALVEFPDGVSLLMQCGMWAADEDTLRILGSRGHIYLPSAFFCAPGNDGFTVQIGDQGRHETAESTNHYTLQADRLAQAVLLGSDLRYSEQDPVLGAAVLEACVRSLRSHRRCEVVG